jgi:hypothetical protein
MIISGTGEFSHDQDVQLLDVGAPARPAARPSLPELIGAPFHGVAKFAAGQLAQLVMKVVVQTNSGDLSGTFHLKPARGAEKVFHFQGAVNREGLFVLHGAAAGERIAVISGNVSRGGTELIGNFVLKEPGMPLSAGTFTAGRGEE